MYILRLLMALTLFGDAASQTSACVHHPLVAVVVPISSCSSCPDSLRAYLYAHDNPVNMTDPGGHESLASVNFTMGLMSWATGHELRTGRSALVGARGMFGAGMDVNNLIYMMEVGETVSDAVGIATLTYGVYKLSQWLVSRGARFFNNASRVMQSLETDPATGRFLFQNLVENEVINPSRLTPAYQVVRNKASGHYTYVVMPNGELRLGQVGLPGFENKHVDLANGQKVLAAGEAVIENGQVKLITDASGHYNGAGLNAAQRTSQRDAALEAFGNHGLPAEGTGTYRNVF